MDKDEKLPLIQTKITMSSSKKLTEVPHDFTLTNESTNFTRLKKAIFALRMRKSSSTQDLLLTQKSIFPNSPTSSFLFNSIENNNNKENEKDESNRIIQKALYNIDYIKKFRKIKVNLFKKKFYKNINIKKIEEEQDKIDNNENNEDENEEESENNKIKIDFKKNIWTVK